MFLVIQVSCLLSLWYLNCGVLPVSESLSFCLNSLSLYCFLFVSGTMVGGGGENDSSAGNALVTPKDGNKAGWEGDKVQMKKQLGLLEGVAIILGIIFGSGMSCL